MSTSRNSQLPTQHYTKLLKDSLERGDEANHAIKSKKNEHKWLKRNNGGNQQQENNAIAGIK